MTHEQYLENLLAANLYLDCPAIRSACAAALKRENLSVAYTSQILTELKQHAAQQDMDLMLPVFAAIAHCVPHDEAFNQVFLLDYYDFLITMPHEKLLLAMLEYRDVWQKWNFMPVPNVGFEYLYAAFFTRCLEVFSAFHLYPNFGNKDINTICYARAVAHLLRHTRDYWLAPLPKVPPFTLLNMLTPVSDWVFCEVLHMKTMQENDTIKSALSYAILKYSGLEVLTPDELYDIMKLSNTTFSPKMEFWEKWLNHQMPLAARIFIDENPNDKAIPEKVKYLLEYAVNALDLSEYLTEKQVFIFVQQIMNTFHTQESESADAQNKQIFGLCVSVCAQQLFEMNIAYGWHTRHEISPALFMPSMLETF